MAARPRKTTPLQPRLSVGAVVIQDGKVLLIQRGKQPRKGAWSIPGGGVELGESLRQATIREAREETGLVVTPGPLVCLYEWMEKTKKGQVTHHHVVADYLCVVSGGTLAPGEDADDARFFSFKEAAALRSTTDGLMKVLVRAFTLWQQAVARASRRASMPGTPHTPPRMLP